MSQTCPSQDLLERLLRGEDLGQNHSEIERHLETCPSCQQLLVKSATADLPGRPECDSTPHPEVLDQAIQKLKAVGPSLASAPTPDPLLSSTTPLRQFGDYEILEELGRGGMGVVYRARQRSLNRIVALKLVLAGQLASPSEVRRFRNEAEAAARLDHPGIVPIYEIGEQDGRHFFSMKLIEGASLSARLGELRSRQSPRQLALLVARMARAVHYAHQRSILHRDLKPANILLDQEDQPHLTDFGLAKLLEQDSSLTRSQAILGTPDYMSPEVAAGRAKDVTTAADVFSLGAILYELLTGNPPFHEATAAATIQKVLNEEPRPPRSVVNSVPRDLETIALKCLEKDLVRRYSSAAEVAEELERFARGETILARPVRSPERVWRWARRKPALAALVVALQIVFALGLVGIVWQWQRADRHAAEESAQRKRAEGLASSEAQHRRTAEELARREAAQHERAVYQQAELLLAEGKFELPLALLSRQLRESPTNAVLAARIRSVLDWHGVCLSAGPPLIWEGAPPRLRESPIRMASYSPDGKTILTVSELPVAVLWDAESLRFLNPLRHGARITGFAFSPTSAVLVTATERGTLLVWNSRDGDPVGEQRLIHGREPLLLAFSPDGSRMVSVSQHMLRLWEMPSRKEITNASPALGDSPLTVSFSFDGRFIVTADQTATVIWSCEGNSLKRAGELPGARDAKFAPDGDHVLLDHTVFWNWRTGQRLAAQFEAGAEPMLASEFSPDGRSLLVAAGELGARLLDLETLRPRVPIVTHEHPVRGVAFSRDGGRMLTFTAGGLVYVWDASTGQAIAQPILNESEILSAEFSLDGQRILILSEGGRAQVWDIRPHGARRLRFLHDGVVTSVQFVNHGEQVLTTSTDSTTALWDRDTGRLVFAPLRHTNAVYAAAVSPDSRWIATVSADHTARIWDAASGMPKLGPLLHAGIPRTVEFSSDGARLLTGADDGVASVWDVTNGQRLLQMEHGAALCSAHFSSDGKQILTASRDGTAKLLDAQTGQPLLKALRHRDAIVEADFVPDGKHLATASRDRTLRFWERETGREAGPPLLHPAGLQLGVLRFDQPGKLVLTAAGSSTHLWYLHDGRPVCPPLEHADLVLDAMFSPDGRLVASASRDDTARFWDLASGLPISEPLEHGARVECLAFSPDGRWLATAAADGGVYLWEVPQLSEPIPEWLPDLAEAPGRLKLDEADQAEPVPPRKLDQVRATIQSAPATNDFTIWARWLLDNSTMHSLSPHSRFSLEDYMALLLTKERVDLLREAALLAPANPHVHAKLARALRAEARPDQVDNLREVDWHSRYAEILAPSDAEVREVRQPVRAAMSNSPAAIAPSVPGSKAKAIRRTTSTHSSAEPK